MSSASNEKQKMTKAAGVVGAATLTSRICGFLRDVAIAFFFGAGPAADAFFVAFRIPNLLRRLFAEGSLTIAFIPVFTEVLRKKGREEAFLLARSTASVLAICLMAVCGLGIYFADEVVRVMAPGFVPDGETFILAVKLTRWCLPFAFFISLVALAGGVLNSMGHFFAPAFAPALLNISIIACAFSMYDLVDPPVMSLAAGVLIGGAAQLILQLPYLKSKGLKILPAWRIHDPALKRIARLMAPAAFGAAVYQVTVFMNTVLASFLPSGSVSFLWYADRLIQFPLGIFAIALSTAVLPSLSRQAADGDYDSLVDTMGFGFRLTLFINLPAMVGLLVLAEPLVWLLFGRGEFSQADSWQTSLAVLGYGIGLWAFAGVRSVVPAFYAMKDTKTPVIVAAVCLVVNLGASLALMFPLKHAGLALATSISGMANLAGLLWLLRKKLGRLGGRKIAASLLRMALASLVMGAAVAGLAYGIDWGDAKGMLSRAGRPLASVAAGALVYLGMGYALKLPEMKEALSALRRK